MLDLDKLLEELKEKNIKFVRIKEEKVREYLKYNSDFYNLIMYTNNFEMYPSPAGDYEGKYIDLDFAYLKDLSILDHLLRILLFDMIMNIEYYLKLRIYNLARDIEIEDGYRIVTMYLEKDYNENRRIHKSIFEKLGSVEYKEIFDKYDIDKDKRLENIPLWEFMRIITFGELIDFYDFFTKEYDLKNEHRYVFLLRDVRRLRNCVCHNQSVLSDLKIKDNNFPIGSLLTIYLEKCDLNERYRKRKLSNSRIRQITSVLYMFNIIVTSDSIKIIIKNKINKYFSRIKIHKEYYINNELLQSIYEYFSIIVTKYYEIDLK